MDEAFRTTGLGGKTRAPVFLQCSIYLQHNDPTTGGGLDVIPGSHYIEDDAWGDNTSEALLNLKRKAVTLDTGPGDLVVWDGRLIHRGTPRSMPSGEKRFAIQWATSKATARQDHYLRRFTLRAENTEGHLARLVDGRYAEIANMRFPDDYPEVFAHRLGALGLSMASLPQ
ncbi:MAG: hypothetical protein GKR94_30510 [Gammaproteobacteria bacterium]|nr:hypothetical protein [Gammaproteobacteria bacterium]